MVWLPANCELISIFVLKTTTTTRLSEHLPLLLQVRMVHHEPCTHSHPQPKGQILLHRPVMFLRNFPTFALAGGTDFMNFIDHLVTNLLRERNTDLPLNFNQHLLKSSNAAFFPRRVCDLFYPVVWSFLPSCVQIVSFLSFSPLQCFRYCLARIWISYKW